MRASEFVHLRHLTDAACIQADLRRTGAGGDVGDGERTQEGGGEGLSQTMTDKKRQWREGGGGGEGEGGVGCGDR